jgi:hypothetical protein
MNENREFAQNIIDKYNTVLGIFPVYLFCLEIPDLKVNKKGKVVYITNDKITLLKLINALEPYTGKYIKRSLHSKYKSLFEQAKQEELL